MIGSIRRRSAWTSFILNNKYSMCALYLPVNKSACQLFGLQKRRQGYNIICNNIFNVGLYMWNATFLAGGPSAGRLPSVYMYVNSVYVNESVCSR